VALGPTASAVGAQATAIGSGAMAPAANSVALGAGSFANEPNTVSVGDAGVFSRRITNVAPGVDPLDAVDVWQLSKAINRADAGIAGVAAALNVPQATQPGKAMVGFGVGFRGDQSAIAFGLSRASRDGRFIVKASGSYDSQGKGTVAGGIGFQF
jgi:autotransporter adhesin